MNHPVQTHKLSKSYRGKSVVHEVNLQIEAGQVYGLLGRNGAGKTTLLRAILGLIQPKQGEALIYGGPLNTAHANHKQKVAYIGQDYRFYDNYQLEEWVHIVATLYEKWNWDKADLLLKTFELSSSAVLGEMSGGERQKASMLIAFSSGAELLILDEPTSALDPLSSVVRHN